MSYDLSKIINKTAAAKEKKLTLGGLMWVQFENTPHSEIYGARSEDGVRYYRVFSRDERPRRRWHVEIIDDEGNPHSDIADIPIFVSVYEAKDAAEIIERRHPLDKYRVAQEKQKWDRYLTRGGKRWEYYGVIDDKQIWALPIGGASSASADARTRAREVAQGAFVIIYDYRAPQEGWVICQREWSAPQGKLGIQRLKNKVIAKCESLEEAQAQILRLT